MEEVTNGTELGTGTDVGASGGMVIWLESITGVGDTELGGAPKIEGKEQE